MSLRLIILLALLFLGALMGYQMLQGSGYVLLSFRHWVIETSIWVFSLLLIGTMAALYFSFHLLINLIKTPSLIGRWRERRSLNQAVNKTVRGLIQLAEGNYKQSEKLLLSGAQGKGKIINYLAAARAAQLSGNFEHSDELIAQASGSAKGAELAIGLQHAQLQLEREHFEKCLATCLRLKKQFPKHHQVNKTLLKAYSALNDWQAVLDLIPSLNKHKLLPNKKTQALEIQTYEKLIGHLISSRNSQSKDPKALLEIWKKIPARTLKQIDFIPLASRFIKHLIELDAQQQAEEQLRSLLQHNYSSELIELYGWCKGKDSRRQLLFAQDQLKHYPNDGKLLLSLGRICLMNEDFSSAQNYFESSLKQQNSAEVRSELSRLYLANNDTQKAIDMLKQGLGLALPDLPLP